LSDLNSEIDSIIRKTEQKLVSDTVESLISAAKLTLKDAKTCIYWRLGTNYLSTLDFYPALALVGPAGSGKNTTMKALRLMPGDSSGMVDCGGLTPAASRDELALFLDKTFFADEFDNIRPEVERIFMSRTTRDMSTQVYKRLVGPGKYEQKAHSIFGATVLHKRNLIDEPALASRSIQIFTRHQEGPYGRFECDVLNLSALKFDMSGVVLEGGRIESTWSPILEIARQLEDVEYIEEISKGMAVETRLLRQKAEYDYSSVVLARVIELLLSKPTLSRWYKIDIELDIGKPIRVDYPNIAPITVNSILNQLGFLTDRRGGRRWLYPEIEAIKVAAQRANYDDAGIAELDEEFQFR